MKSITEAELAVETIRRCYPTLYRTRERAVTALLLNDYGWDEKGNLKLGENLQNMRTQILAGTASSWEDLYDEALQKHAEETTSTGESVAATKAIYRQMDQEQDAMPRQYYCICCERSNLANIPEHVSPEWRVLCLEAAELLAAAKTDFDEWSILTKTEQERSQKLQQMSPTERLEREQIADEILGELFAERPQNNVNAELKMRRQVDCSPAARAERANAGNKEVVQLGRTVLDILR